MSFALEVKEEVVSHSFSLEQQKVFLSGFIKYNGELIYSNGSNKLKLTTISNRIARSLLTFVKHFFDGDIQISIIQPQTLKRNKIFQIVMVGDVKKFLNDIQATNENSAKKIEIPDDWKNNEELLRAYIGGMFLAVGSVNAPSTANYHLELQFKTLEDSKYLCELLKKYNFTFKILERSANRYITYIKKSLLVSDFLKFIDAPQSVMRFENERISRDMFNNINRISNIDISNQSKVLKTGEEQTKKIKYIQKQDMLFKLSPKGQTLALIRLKKPDFSYSELEEEMYKKGYEITKSGISNLFRNIDKLYTELKEGKQNG